MQTLATKIAQAVTTRVDGAWQRHAPARYAATALSGRSGIGRWGTENSYPVLYLGQPTDSVVVEAYRHLVDPVADNPDIVERIPPRVLVTCTVAVSDILDLRRAGNRLLLDLPLEVLESATRDRPAYRRCQEVSAVAHQLGLHGIIAPAATHLGTTLALFTDLLDPQEQPRRTDEQFWAHLPPDPRVSTPLRHLRAVSDTD